MKPITVEHIAHAREWKDHVEKASKTIWYSRGKKEWLPMAHILAPTGFGYINRIYALPFNGELEKDLTVEMLKIECKRHDAVGYCMITEAWFLKGKYTDEGDPEEKDEIDAIMSGKMRVSESSRRIEVLMIQFETRHKIEMSTYEIYHKGNKRGLKQLERWPDQKVQYKGRMTHILAEDFNMPSN